MEKVLTCVVQIITQTDCVTEHLKTMVLSKDSSIINYTEVNLSRGLIGSRSKSDHGQLDDKYHVFYLFIYRL